MFSKHTMVDVDLPIFGSLLIKAKKPTLGPY
jgi:hypothetical protein